MAAATTRDTPEAPLIEPQGRTPFDRFAALARAVVAVPKAEVDEAERRYKRRRARKKASAGHR